MAVPGDSVPLRSTSAPPTVWLVRFANGQPAGPSPCPCPGVDKPPEQPYLIFLWHNLGDVFEYSVCL